MIDTNVVENSVLSSSDGESALEKWIAADEDRPVYEDISGRQVGGPFSEYDTMGRKQPRRLGIPDYLLLVARIEPARVRRIPSAAITEERADEEGEFALVACPCGSHPVVRLSLRRCDGCERYYVLVEPGAVYVAYGAMTVPPLNPSVCS